MRKLELLSPAKLNLYLKVIKKRSDGYHEIISLFERINLVDYILIEKFKKGIHFSSNSKDLGPPENNLAFKAACLFSQKLKRDLGVKIKIFKNIPIGSGLGGGSSNAAVVLLGINQLYELGMDKARLSRWAAGLGSDVNFFLSEKNFALGKGRGEKIFPLDLPTQLWQVLIYPDLVIHTREIYDLFDKHFEEYPLNADLHGLNANVCGFYREDIRENPGEIRDYPRSKIVFRQPPERGLTNNASDVKILLQTLKRNDIEVMGKLLFNHLEEVVLRKYPYLSVWKTKLLGKGAKGAIVAGSGSSIFGLFSNRKEAEAGMRQLQKGKEGKIFLVSTY